VAVPARMRFRGRLLLASRPLGAGLRRHRVTIHRRWRAVGPAAAPASASRDRERRRHASASLCPVLPASAGDPDGDPRCRRRPPGPRDPRSAPRLGLQTLTAGVCGHMLRAARTAAGSVPARLASGSGVHASLSPFFQPYAGPLAAALVVVLRPPRSDARSSEGVGCRQRPSGRDRHPRPVQPPGRDRRRRLKAASPGVYDVAGRLSGFRPSDRRHGRESSRRCPRHPRHPGPLLETITVSPTPRHLPGPINRPASSGARPPAAPGQHPRATLASEPGVNVRTFGSATRGRSCAARQRPRPGPRERGPHGDLSASPPTTA
jgi:hypothetical protein